MVWMTGRPLIRAAVRAGGQQGRGGLVFAALQVDSRFDQVGEDQSHPVRHGAVFRGSSAEPVQRRSG